MKSRWPPFLAFIGLALLGLGIYTQFKKSPAPETPSRRLLQTKEVEVPAKTMWFDTGLDVTGKYVDIQYLHGEWTSGGEVLKWSDGEGATVGRIGDMIVPSAKIRALVGKTDDGHFLVGNGRTFSGKRGKLFLSMNDEEGKFGDNQGALLMRVSLYQE